MKRDIHDLTVIDIPNQREFIAELTDDSGDAIDIDDLAEELVDYMRGELQDSESAIFTQILPLVTQAISTTLISIFGKEVGVFYLSDPLSRVGFMQTMIVGFALAKVITSQKLQINTTIKSLTEDEMETIVRRGQAKSSAELARLAGHNPLKILQEMQDRGMVTEEDIEAIVNGVDDDQS